jgi:hypothetical protein
MAMSAKLEQLRRSTPDLAQLDPLSMEVRTWLDEAYAAVRKVDAAEGVILKLHEHSLRDPRFKATASAEIVHTIDRARATHALLHRTGRAS